MNEVGSALLLRRGEGVPALQPVQMLAAAAALRIGAFGMSDAAPGLHPVHVARLDGRERAEAVAVHDLAVEQITHRGEPDVRVRAYVEARARAEPGRSAMIEDGERPRPGAARPAAAPRRTVSPPRSTVRGTIAMSIASQLNASPRTGSFAGKKLMADH